MIDDFYKALQKYTKEPTNDVLFDDCILEFLKNYKQNPNDIDIQKFPSLISLFIEYLTAKRKSVK